MKRLLPLLISFLLVSCASYTISEARNKIQYPEPVSISTRYSEIKEAEEKEEERIYREKLKKYIAKYHDEDVAREKLNKDELRKFYLTHPVKAVKRIFEKMRGK